MPASAKPRKLFLGGAQDGKSREVEPAEQGTPPFLCFFGSFFKHDFWSKIAFKKILVQKQGQRAPVLKFPGTNFTNIVDFWPWTPVRKYTNTHHIRASPSKKYYCVLCGGWPVISPYYAVGKSIFEKNRAATFFKKSIANEIFRSRSIFWKKLIAIFFKNRFTLRSRKKV